MLRLLRKFLRQSAQPPPLLAWSVKIAFQNNLVMGVMLEAATTDILVLIKMVMVVEAAGGGATAVAAVDLRVIGANTLLAVEMFTVAREADFIGVRLTTKEAEIMHANNHTLIAGTGLMLIRDILSLLRESPSMIRTETNSAQHISSIPKQELRMTQQLRRLMMMRPPY